MFDKNADPLSPFIPHLHMESLLEHFPYEEREQVMNIIDYTLEYYSTNDMVEISVDGDGNFYYTLTTKGMQYAKRLLSNL